MIKRSTYFIITLFTVLLFLSFQLLVLNFVWNDSWISNTNADIVENKGTGLVSNITEEKPSDRPAQVSDDVLYYVISPSQNEVFRTVTSTLRLIKKPYESYTSLDLIPGEAPGNLVGIIICEGNLDRIGDIDILFENYAAAGKDVVFASLFDITADNFKKYSETLGIVSYEKPYTHDSIDFLEGMVVSGMYIDAEIDVTCNKIKLNGTTRFFAVCHDDDDQVRYHNRNPLIWRTYYKSGMIMVFNNDLLKDFSFTGVLTGVLGTSKDVFYYPVANSGFLAVDALPYYSDENSASILKAYNRSVLQFQRDVVWSDMVSIVKRLGVAFSFFPYAGANQDSIEPQLIEYFGKEITMNGCEVGYYPSNYFNKYFKQYTPRVALGYPMNNASGQITFNKNGFGYLSESTVALPIISSGFELSSGDIYRTFSLASGLGYTSHYIDMKEILQNPDGSDLWTDMKLDFVKSVYPVTKKYEFLEFETASQSARKLSLYLNSRPDVQIGKDNITVKSQSIGDISYIIRTNREIVWTESCVFTRINTNTYLVTVSGEDAILHTRDKYTAENP